jgi:hypothetical protein
MPAANRIVPYIPSSDETADDGAPEDALGNEDGADAESDGDDREQALNSRRQNDG